MVNNVDVELLHGWNQRAMVFLVDTSSGLLAECRKSVLIKINSKLGEMASKEPSSEAKGLLFGEGMVKSLVNIYLCSLL